MADQMNVFLGSIVFEDIKKTNYRFNNKIKSKKVYSYENYSEIAKKTKDEIKK
jgi:hypothetical protein